jgi:putative phage-type endonuclease
VLTQEQLEHRCHRIGSSDIAAIAGLNPYRGALAVWPYKGERGLEELAQARPDEFAMYAGHAYEWPIAMLGARVLGCSVEQYQETVDHPTCRIASATPDALLTIGKQRALAECKAIHWRMRDDWRDGVPAYVDAQVQWQLECCDLELAYVFAGSALTDPPDVYRVDRDRELAAGLLDIAVEWWDRYVVGNRPPPVDGTKAAADWLRQRYPEHKRPLLEATPEIDRLAEQLRLSRATLAAAQAEDKRLTQELQDMIGDAEGVETCAGRITWRSGKRRTYVDTKAIVHDVRKLLSSGTLQPGKELATFDAIVAMHTDERPGARTFRVPAGWTK